MLFFSLRLSVVFSLTAEIAERAEEYYYFINEYEILNTITLNTNNVANANLQSLSSMKLITEMIIRMIGVIINNIIPEYK